MKPKPLLLGLLFTVAVLVVAGWAVPATDLQAGFQDRAAAPQTIEEQPGGERGSGEIVPRRRIRGDRIAVFDSVVVPAGAIQDGDVICVFGDATIEGDVTGSVIVVGGSLRLTGDVRRDVLSIVSSTVLEAGTRIGGELVNVGRLDDRGAEVRHGYTDVPLPIGKIGRPFSVLASMLLWMRLLAVVLFFVIILLLAALFPERIRAMSDEAPARYFAAFFAGLAAYVALWLIKTLLLVTLIGVPLVYLAFLVLKWMGRAAILHLPGQRLGRAVGGEMSLLGAVLLGLVPYTLLLIVPLLFGGIGGIVLHLFMTGVLWFLVDVPGIGLVLLTRAGTRTRVVPVAPQPPAPPAPIAPAVGGPPQAGA